MHLLFDTCNQVVAELISLQTKQTKWVLFVADQHGDSIPSLLAHCAEAGLDVCGGLFPGLIYGTARLNCGIVAIPLPDGSQVVLAALTASEVRWATSPPRLIDVTQFTLVMLVDAQAPGISGLMEDVYDRYGARTHCVGAGAGYQDLRTAPVIFTSAGMASDTVLMAVVPKRTSVQVRHGWKRVNGPFVASRTCTNRIAELNWEPAGSFYRSQVVKENPAYLDKPIFPDLNVSYPLCIAREGSEDVIRDPMAITENDEIALLSSVSENSVMYLVHGTKESLIEAARQAVEDAGAPPDVDLCFIIDCYSRALMMGDSFPEELVAVADALGKFTDIVPQGVLALGEISSNGHQSLEFFNKTFVLTLAHSSPIPIDC